jgi:L-ascorbate metabolism protein UlaG (beta-lactamase superfamily)
MQITWYGLSCFRLTERGMATVVTDPFDNAVVGFEPLKLRADIISVSHDMPGHNHTEAVKGATHTLTGPGEFEIGGVFITAIQTLGKKEDGNGKNTLYVFDYDGVTVAHLGDLSRVLTQSEVEALGTVHVALVPVGGGGGLNPAKAAEVISMIEPGIVIPMHYKTNGDKLNLAPLSKFLQEMGLSDLEPQPSLKVTSSSVPEETRVVILDYDQKEGA